MKIKYIVFISTLFFQLHSFAQSSDEKRANNAFADRAYEAATQLYLKLDNPSQQVLQNLADSYFYISQMEKASGAYQKLFTTYKDSVPKEYLFRYAHALKGIKSYDEADSILGVYTGKPYATQQFIQDIQEKVPYNYFSKPLQKSVSGDFGLAYFKQDSVIFAATRNKENPTFSWDCTPYLDLYTATVSEDKTLENIQSFSEDINTTSHESSAVFTKDGKTMYFNRTSRKRNKINDEKVATVRMFKAEFIDGSWQNITELPFSSETYNTMHPALSNDDKRLYFSSDKDGSYDLFYVDIKEDGIYSYPKNLGSGINTKEREQFPFIAEDGILYFASNGLKGMGGLDIYMTSPTDSTFTKPMNLGATLNSELDDFAFVVNTEKNTGYFSSNRSGGDKIYAFDREDNLNSFVVEGDVTDKHSHEPLPGTTVRLYDENGEVVGETVVGADAHYKFKTKPFTTYTIEAQKSLYVPYTNEFTTGEEGVFYYSIGLSLESFDDAEDIVVVREDGLMYIELENIYFDLDKWDIKPQAARILNVLVDLMKKYPTMEVEIDAHTDSQGTDAYNIKLSKNRAASAVDYLVSQGIERRRLTSEGYGERKPLVACGENCTQVEHAINRRCEFIVRN
ncbi:WD40-like Beta Propeller Repeat [Pustulibacterium marinum]|uniref:WD40-like Beta Propeller Repeat n=1 Tax=Pustulibacterium marinum TaxID=1224947 RepID=A0A1I7G1Z1_9FLAO|nr:OmpA family protein [Pustulibacterium marinum]SFU42480.1 WD40-like Beta Propeller Repeat [Pustulibacterium marinum]